MCFITSSFLWKWTKNFFFLSMYQRPWAFSIFSGIFIFSVQRDAHLFSIISSYSVFLFIFQAQQIDQEIARHLAEKERRRRRSVYIYIWVVNFLRSQVLLGVHVWDFDAKNYLILADCHCCYLVNICSFVSTVAPCFLIRLPFFI